MRISPYAWIIYFLVVVVEAGRRCRKTQLHRSTMALAVSAWLVEAAAVSVSAWVEVEEVVAAEVAEVVWDQPLRLFPFRWIGHS
jgi:hypothetical protein